VPTICIDGQITFVSRIPKRDELIAAIQKRVFEKLRKKIQRRRASVLILGDGSEACRQVKANVQQAITELGAEVEVQVHTDEKEFYAYGLSPVQKPAVIIARYNVKTTRAVPEISVIKEWIKDIL